MRIITFFSVVLYLFLAACAVPEFAKPSKVDTRNNPIGAKERARKNVEEGRGVSLKDAIGGRRGTTYEFSTSNPLWRASLELIDFMPLTTVDYSGGIIITDWFSDNNVSNEAIKITIRFLSNEVQSNSVKIVVHKKDCDINNKCSISEIDTNIKMELSQAILKRAAKLESDSKEKKKK